MTTAGAHPSFSIIIPTYQRRDAVCAAVRAAARLEYAGKLELVVVVDGSTDGTEAALQAISPPFALRIVAQKNGGLAAARNRGAAEAKGDILLFLDDDMICRPDLVKQHCQSFAEGADAVVGEIPLDPATSSNFLTDAIARWAMDSGLEARERPVLTPFNIYGGQLSVRRDVFESLGGFDRAFTEGGGYGKEDADFGARLLACHQVRHNPDAISFHRFVVSPREYLRRGFALGRADVRFMRRYPQFAYDLLERNHVSRRRTRWILRPLARIPLLPQIMVGLTAGLTEAILRSPMRSSLWFGKYFHAMRQLAYWSGINHGGGINPSGAALVLCYHAIDDYSADPVLADYSIPRARFERQLKSLRRRRFRFIGGQDLLDALDNSRELPKRAVLLTFDDCYCDLPAVTQELLQPQGIPALAFAVTGMASGTNEWDQKIGAMTRPLLGWEQLKRLGEAGIEIGSHSQSHARMPELSSEQMLRETRGAAEDFEVHGLPRPRFFAFPYGERDGRCSAAVRAATYAAAFGLADRKITGEMNRFDLARVEILARDGFLRFWLKTTWPRLATALRWRQHLGKWKRSVKRALLANPGQ